MAGLRPLLGLAATGYGLLVVLGLVAHEAAWLGWLSLGAGLALLAAGIPSLPPLPLSRSPPSWTRRGLLAALGVSLAFGVVAYNVATRSSLSLPELAFAAYGALLALASRTLDRRVGPMPVASAVAWSFPLLLAPLTLFALNAVVTRPGAAPMAAPLVVALVVHPTSWLLAALGVQNRVVGDDIILPTAQGSLSLGVGLVCAGLYPMVLFLGLLAMHAWKDGLPRARALRLAAGGLAALWAVNLVRLLVVVEAGRRWGAGALQAVHAHAGWVLFVLFMVGFWAYALRKPSPTAAPAEAA